MVPPAVGRSTSSVRSRHPTADRHRKPFAGAGLEIRDRLVAELARGSLFHFNAAIEMVETGEESEPSRLIFFSYAREDWAEPLPEFYEALKKEVADQLGWRKPPRWFRDREAIRVGDRWWTELSLALQTCHVMVRLYTPRLGSSPFCEMEHTFFQERLIAEEQRAVDQEASGAARDRLPASRPAPRLLTIVWRPQGLKKGEEQLDAAGYPPSYLERGLRALWVRAGSDGESAHDKQECFDRLAASIVDAVRAPPLAAGTVPPTRPSEASPESSGTVRSHRSTPMARRAGARSLRGIVMAVIALGVALGLGLVGAQLVRKVRLVENAQAPLRSLAEWAASVNAAFPYGGESLIPPLEPYRETGPEPTPTTPRPPVLPKPSPSPRPDEPLRECQWSDVSSTVVGVKRSNAEWAGTKLSITVSRGASGGWSVRGANRAFASKVQTALNSRRFNCRGPSTPFNREVK